MHWFWRAVLLWILATLAGTFALTIHEPPPPTHLTLYLSHFFESAVVVSLFWIPWIIACCIVMIIRGVKPAEPDEPRCRKCGYNLTGNTSGICPECGEKIPLSK